jgi:hypothetical protein
MRRREKKGMEGGEYEGGEGTKNNYQIFRNLLKNLKKQRVAIKKSY